MGALAAAAPAAAAPAAAAPAPAASAARAAEPAARPTAAPARVARRRLRFATFNIQSKSIVFSKTHVWDNRINALVHTLRELKLDVVCFQEPLASQLDDLRKLVGDEFEILNGETVWAANPLATSAYGQGGVAEKKGLGMHNAIMFRRSRLFATDIARTAWITRAGPVCEVPISSSAGSTHGGPRAVTHVPLAFVGDEQPSLVAASTHLYYRRETPVTSGEDSPPARLLRAVAAAERKHGVPVVLGGDFNSSKDRSTCGELELYRRLVGGARQQRDPDDSGNESDDDGGAGRAPSLVDAWRVAEVTRPHGHVGSTCHSYRSQAKRDEANHGENAEHRRDVAEGRAREDDRHIDWILLSADPRRRPRVCLAEVGTEDLVPLHVEDRDYTMTNKHGEARCGGHRANWGGEQGWFPSDHYPVIAELEFDAPQVAGKRAHGAV